TSDLLQALTQPVTLICGGERRYRDEPAYTERGIHLRRIAGAGHFVMNDAPAVVVAALDDAAPEELERTSPARCGGTPGDGPPTRAARSASTSSSRRCTRSAASASARVGPSLTITTGMSCRRGARANRSPECTVSDERSTSSASATSSAAKAAATTSRRAD